MYLTSAFGSHTSWNRQAPCVYIAKTIISVDRDHCQSEIIKKRSDELAAYLVFLQMP